MISCQYCQNSIEDELLDDHEQFCGMNPTQQEEKRKLGEVEIAKKVIVIVDDKPVRMYWSHSEMGEAEFNIFEVLERWELLYFSEKAHWFWPAFLKARGFTNIINEGKE